MGAKRRHALNLICTFMPAKTQFFMPRRRRSFPDHPIPGLTAGHGYCEYCRASGMLVHGSIECPYHVRFFCRPAGAVDLFPREPRAALARVYCLARLRRGVRLQSIGLARSTCPGGAKKKVAGGKRSAAPGESIGIKSPSGAKEIHLVLTADAMIGHILIHSSIFVPFGSESVSGL